MTDDTPFAPSPPHKRRERYRGKHPRRFEHKYKEHRHDAATVAKVMASGKTPAGTHRPIMVAEILKVLAPQPGDVVMDCTLGYGGHAQELLARIAPQGRLVGLDADSIESPKTESRLRGLGFGPELLTVVRCNFAGLPRVLWDLDIKTADIILADLGVSSMQLDDPSRGFSVKQSGPLDMRMNPQRGQPASALLQRLDAAELQRLLEENADEPRAAELAPALAGKLFSTTVDLTSAIRRVLPGVAREASQDTIRRVFQALRIAVNDEFSALDTLLRALPSCLKPGGRAAILTFHSGEDRRVKKAFESALREGLYAEIGGPQCPGPEERRANPRSAPAKLRWAWRAL